MEKIVKKVRYASTGYGKGSVQLVNKDGWLISEAKYRMTLDNAKALAKQLDVPFEEME